MNDRAVRDDEQLSVGTRVRVVDTGYGATSADVGRWGQVIAHEAGERAAVELEPTGRTPQREIKRLHPDEIVVELASPATYQCVQHVDRTIECGPDCVELTRAWNSGAVAR